MIDAYLQWVRRNFGLCLLIVIGALCLTGHLA
jgi:hypothetical protein